MPPFDMDVRDRGPLYVPDGHGGWICNDKAHTKETAAAWTLTEYRRCAADPAHFVFNYCHAQNLHDEDAMPAAPAVQLIPDWPHVRAILAALYPLRDVLIEKSRRMLVSWVLMAAILHDLLFFKN